MLIFDTMPHVCEGAYRIHIHRLRRRRAVIRPKDVSMPDVMAFMTGAAEPPAFALAA